MGFGNQMPSFILPVPVTWSLKQAGTTILKTCSIAPADGVAFALALILIKTGMDGQHLDCLGIADEELLHLEIHFHSQLIQLVTGFQKLDSISTEAADGFDQY